MFAFLDRFERAITYILVVLMAIIVALAALELAWLVITDIITPPFLLLELSELLDLFGFLMLVLIGLELLETIKAYLIEHIIHAEVVIEVAMIAIVRKVIILEVKDLESLTLIGIAAIVVALAIAFGVIKRGIAKPQH